MSGDAGLGTRFWRLYASSATSNLADGIGKVALPLIASSITRKPLAISGLLSFAFVPWLLFALPSGVLVDRVDRRYAMSAANVVRAVAMGVLAVLLATGSAGIVALYAVAFALGMAETVYDSATRALLPQVVGADRLDRANGQLTVEETLGQTFLGSPVGSALFAVAASLPVLLNAGGFAAAAVLVLTLRGRFRPVRTAQRSTVRAEIADGVRWLAHHPLLRGLTLISATTALIQTMASGVLVLPNHHPVVLAKRAATVDALSDGRLRLCVGVGWLREEIEACGTEFESRGRRADEQLAVLRALWADQPEGVTHRGEFFQFANAVCSPKPVAGENLPVHIGGHSTAAARRAGRFGDGFQPLGVTGAKLDSLLLLMRDEASAVGRNPADIEVTLGHSVTKIDAERAERLAAHGADRLVLAMPTITDLEQAKDELSACAQRLSLPT